MKFKICWLSGQQICILQGLVYHLSVDLVDKMFYKYDEYGRGTSEDHRDMEKILTKYNLGRGETDSIFCGKGT